MSARKASARVPATRADAPTFGVEEEFFLVDLRTGRSPGRVSKTFVKACQRRLGQAVAFELQQAQVELVSPIFDDATHALDTVISLRAQIAEIAQAMHLGIIACGSHPIARWQQQVQADKPRYRRFADEYQIVGLRGFFCGLHVHIGVPGVDRVQLMNRMLSWLPLFLALSAASPFWNLRRTGMFSYRQSAYTEWPRTGTPDFFADEAEYQHFVAILRRAGSIRDGGELWWTIRPSPRHPTLELRIADSCTRAADTIALATLFRCLVSAHLRLPELGAQRSSATRRLIEENRWRAERYGIEAEFIDETRERTVPAAELVEEALELVKPDAQTLDPDGSLRALRTILARGTSAHAQLQAYDNALAAGASHRDALRAVIDWLLNATVPGQRLA
ncbi:MAG: carboxylate-amine ligase [Proteobacteria bacterium]|uniref:carboxylate-amine ligase n=1 Tax=Rudaea sp. TaxID=2136325 RepID=UPI003784712E|nr:carboxylate-amine ligase [Pseudomonadota bacterium]